MMLNVMFRSRTRWWKTRALAAAAVLAWLFIVVRMTSNDAPTNDISTMVFNGVIVMPLGAIAVLAFVFWQQEWIDRSHGEAEDV